LPQIYFLRGTFYIISLMIKGFKEFILKGNVVDLAVGVVIGVAFGAVVTALVKDIITPFIAAIGGKPDFSKLSFTINNSVFMIGDFLNALVSFIIVAAVIYFFVILPMNKLISLTKKEKTSDPTTKKCPECLSDISLGAKRCPFCTSVLKK
jgi:large conductance mechanosensitive channel